MPLTPTAVADSLVGYALATSLLTTGEWNATDALGLTLACGVSVLAYWFGMATNDVLDFRKDRELAPGRPLPSGALGLRAAMIVAAVLLSGAYVVAAFARVLPALWALVVLILVYNAGGKRVPVLGNLLMGSCRAANLLLGASAVAGVSILDVLRSPQLVAAAAVLGLYIAAVTAISVLEDRAHDSRRLLRLAGLLLIFPIGVLVPGWRSLGAWLNGGVFMAYLWGSVRMAEAESTRASGETHPAALVVRRGLGALYFVDAGLLWWHDLAVPAAAVYALFGLGWYWMRWWVQSGQS